MDQHELWNVDLLKQLFPQNMVTKIRGSLPLDVNSGKDICCWPSDKKMWMLICVLILVLVEIFRGQNFRQPLVMPFGCGGIRNNMIRIL